MNLQSLGDASSRDHFIGVEVGPAIIRAGVFSPSLQLLGKTKFSTKAERGPEAVIERIARCIQYAADECDLPLSQIRACGVGVAGRVRGKSGVVETAADLAWHNVPLGRELERHISMPVLVGQIYDFGTLGIFHHEARLIPQSFAAIFLGPQLGGGVIRNGELDDLTALASTCFPFESPECNVFTTMPQAQFRHFRGRDFRKALRKDNGLVRQFVREIAVQAGRIAAALTDRYAPEVIALGGGVLDEMKDEILQVVESSYREACSGERRPAASFLPSTLGDLAGVIGAAVQAARSTIPAHKAKSLAIA